MSERARDAAGVTVIVVAVVALYWPIVDLWWMWDDAYLLHIAAVQPASSAFLSADVWRNLGLFTPMLTAAFDASLTLVGFDARAFYLLHLLGMALATAVLYLTLRLWLPATSALAGSLLFAAGVPMCGVLTRLSAMHYTLALVGATGATAVFAIGVRRQLPWLGLLSAGLYLAAMLARETAVPLLILLLLLPEGRNWRRLQPHMAVLTIYLIWRATLLGTLVGGYGFAVTSGEVVPLLLHLPSLVMRAVAGPDPFAGSLLVIVLAIGLARGLGQWALAWRAVVALGLSIAPVLVVAKAFDVRYGLVTWLALAVLFVIGCQRLPRRVQYPVLALAVLLAGVTNRQQWRLEFASSARQSAEARAFFDLTPGSLLAYPTIPPAAILELRWLKEDWLRRPAGAGWFYDEIFVCAGHAAGTRVVGWNEQRMAVEETSVDPRCHAVREAPLAVTFQHRDERLYWRFGPYRDGRWSVVMDEGRRAFGLSAQDGFRLPGVSGLSLQVRYDSPEGWRTYSPMLALDFARAPDLTFER